MQFSSRDFLAMLPNIQLIIKEAGNIILNYYEKNNIDPKIKSDNTPVTDADISSHYYIEQELSKISSDLIISEEGKLTTCDQEYHRYWLIDPLDGTKNFIARNGEFCTNIALIEKGRPVLGVIYLPFQKELFYAFSGGGAFKVDADGQKQQLMSRSFCSSRKPIVLVSHFHQHKVNDLDVSNKPYTIVHMGSAVKFCRLAQGTADLYIKKGYTSSWDTAAGQCILEEAGGKVVDLQNVALSYSSKNNQKNPYFLACGDKSVRPSTLFEAEVC